MPRPATGQVKWRRDPADGVERWCVRVTLLDKSRPWYGMKGIAREDEAGARARAPEVVRFAREGAVVKASQGETCNEWAERWFEAREGRGNTSVRDDRYRWGKWIAPRIGTKTPAEVTRDDVEDLRDGLDAAIVAWHAKGKGEGRLAPKTARSVWTVLRGAFRDMVDSKRRDLRVPGLAVSPAASVQAPERGQPKAKCFVYPSEFLALVRCEAVPLGWRRLHAVACYSALRPGELRVLRWTDVDLEHGIIHVVKAWDYVRGKVKATKTGETRTVPIEATLRPLLAVLKEAAEPEDLVVPLMSAANEDTMAKELRSHLATAGVTRAALFAASTTELAIRFRSWRDTGITWWIVRGDSPAKVMRRAGHRDFQTTSGYVVAAETVAEGFGATFPELPAGLVPVSDRKGLEKALRPMIPPGTRCEGRDLKAPDPSEKQGDPDATVTEGEHVGSPSMPSDPDPLAAVRAAVKAAVDAGDLALATKLIDVLRAAQAPAPAPATVVALPLRSVK